MWQIYASLPLWFHAYIILWWSCNFSNRTQKEKSFIFSTQKGKQRRNKICNLSGMGILPRPLPECGGVLQEHGWRQDPNTCPLPVWPRGKHSVQTPPHTHKHTHARVHTYTHMRAYTHTHTCACTHIHTHLYVCAPVCMSSCNACITNEISYP